MRTYSELIKMKTFDERFNYLMLSGSVGKETFGFDRYLNQVLYKSQEWRKTRDLVILRDNGCDLGVEGFEIYGRCLIHHMNPISMEDIVRRSPKIFDPEFLITTTSKTHNAIHYGSLELLTTSPVERKPGDTKLW